MEQTLLTLGLSCYLLATALALLIRHKVLILMLAGITLHGIAIGQRWLEVGHGPYLGLYDSLSSNLWIQLLLLTLLASFNQSIRKTLPHGLALALPFVLWLMMIDPQDHNLPPTYATNWFFLHLYSGKLAYALLFIAMSQTLYQLQHKQVATNGIQQTMLLAFLCHSLLLFAGGNWAYLAWGKYWDWNPLEIWSLLTWIGFGVYFHRPGISGFKWLPGQTGFVVVIYVFAILGFYGVPFFSYATHQGLV